MPHYFADYDTDVHFISAEELARDHAAMPHGGTVLRSGTTGTAGGTDVENSQVVEYTLKLGHNPQFTSSVLVAYARARSEEHTSELQSRGHLVCRLLLEKKKNVTRYRKST